MQGSGLFQQCNEEGMGRPYLRPVLLPVALQDLEGHGPCDMADSTERGRLHQPSGVVVPALHDWLCLPL